MPRVLADSRPADVNLLRRPGWERILRAALASAALAVMPAQAAQTGQVEEKQMASSDDKAAGLTRLGTVAGLDSKSNELIEVNDHLWVSKDISDSIMVTTPEGNVVINSGMPGNGEQHRQRYQTVSEKPVEYLIITQCHGDHFGGVYEIRDPGTRVITHQNFQECREYWRILDDFYKRRSHKLWGSVLGKRGDVKDIIREVTPDITFRDDYTLELGGRQFELYAAPGGESQDGVVVWLPQDRIAITGNLFGPIYGNMPNLYTIRGDKIRSAKGFVKSLDMVAALRPAIIVTGHEVIRGEDEIQASLDKLRRAVLYVHDYTIEGMQSGKDVHTLMREVSLPEELRVGQAHGKLSWCVRAIWEEYAGWFHYDATTSLYGVPASTVAADLTELAGGADALAARAEQHLAQQQPLQALHLVDTALQAEPDNQRALRARIDAHNQLLQASGGENFSEVMWLKSEIEAAEAKLD
jgi:alkyl sulfatase BDS1-like metallo-beta-lactamase superfamily hydrolase